MNHVVPHDDLLPTALRLAGDIAGGDPRTVAALNETYRDVAALPLGEGLALERERFSDLGVQPGRHREPAGRRADRGRPLQPGSRVPDVGSPDAGRVRSAPQPQPARRGSGGAATRWPMIGGTTG